MSRPDNELRRTLWALADRWEQPGECQQGSHPSVQVCSWCGGRQAAARELREALTYPAATEADEEQLQRIFGKTSEELADEAEEGYDVRPAVCVQCGRDCPALPGPVRYCSPQCMVDAQAGKEPARLDPADMYGREL